MAGETLDNDDPEHITWLFQRAQARAKEFNIEGVTYSMTQGVVKNIIPAIASTNAIIAASCCNEALKILTSAAPALGFPGTSNYMMYTGDDSVYTYTFEHQRKEECPVCAPPRAMEVEESWTLQDLIDKFKKMSDPVYINPSFTEGGRPLYFPQPEALYEMTRGNLKRKLAELFDEGDEMAVTDPSYQNSHRFRLSFRSREEA